MIVLLIFMLQSWLPQSCSTATSYLKKPKLSFLRPRECFATLATHLPHSLQDLEFLCTRVTTVKAAVDNHKSDQFLHAHELQIQDGITPGWWIQRLSPLLSPKITLIDFLLLQMPGRLKIARRTNVSDWRASHASNIVLLCPAQVFQLKLSNGEYKKAVPGEPFSGVNRGQTYSLKTSENKVRWGVLKFGSLVGFWFVQFVIIVQAIKYVQSETLFLSYT